MNILKKPNFSKIKISFPNMLKTNRSSFYFLKLQHLNFCENSALNASKNFKSLYKKKIYHDTSKTSNENNFQSLRQSYQEQELQSQNKMAISEFKQSQTNSLNSQQSSRDEKIYDMHKEFLDRMVKIKYLSIKLKI